MQKILLILRREYNARVYTRAFFVLCLLLPVLLAAMFMSMIIDTKPSQRRTANNKLTVLQVVDETGLLNEMPPQIGNMDFKASTLNIKNAIKNLNNNRTDGILNIVDSAGSPHLKLFINRTLSAGDIRAIQLNFQNIIEAPEKQKEESSHTSQFRMEVINVNASHINQPNVVHGKTVMGIALAGIIYFFIFFYGVRTLNAVAEEKMNRMSEIIISSTSPFELMLGKILGTTLAVFTQIIIVACITAVLVKLVMIGVAPDPIPVNTAPVSAQGIPPSFLHTFSLGEWFKIIVGFTILFVFGFMLYAAIFAAIGAAMEPNADTFQFIFPVLLPLVFSLILVISSALSDYENKVVIWASYIPFTSPVVMPLRLVHGVTWWQLIISITVLITGFIGITFLAGRIFRVGILLYGTKPSFKMIGKWLFTAE